LASASPRRAEILTTLGIPFEVHPSGVDEAALNIDDALDFVRQAALLKARRVLDDLGGRSAFVLAADTIVCVSGERLGKPEDDADALRMLACLAGRDHLVRTAIVLGQTTEGVLDSAVTETRVWFRQAGADELARYAASAEGRDKAGAYGVQGLASGFVTRLEGSYTNVVGLPAAETVMMLRKHGALDRWP
jgi:septum formation protein